MYDKNTKKLKPEYLPTTILTPIKECLSRFNNIKEIGQGNIQNFYDLIDNIKFKRVKTIGGFNYDIEDDEDYADLRIYDTARMTDTHFTYGYELRMNYFNFCRIIAYLFNSTGELALATIEEGVDSNTLKNLLTLINNPNKEKMLSSYRFLSDEKKLYTGDRMEVKILDIKFALGKSHTFPILLISPSFEGKIVKFINRGYISNIEGI